MRTNDATNGEVPAIEYKDFSRNLQIDARHGGNGFEREYYDHYAAQGIRLKTRYRPRGLKQVR